MKKGDLILIGAILIIMLFIGAGYLIYMNNLGSERYVNIYIDNKLYKSVKLTEDIDMTIPVDNEYGYNLIRIYNNGVQVTEADCHNQIDVKQGFVKSPGIPIVCVPHRLVVLIEGDSGDSDVDDIAS